MFFCNYKKGCPPVADGLFLSNAITMRIVATIPHPVFKITVFEMNRKYSVQFEVGLLRQVYSFRDGVFENVEQLKTSISEDLLKDVSEVFKSMYGTSVKMSNNQSH